MEINIGQDIFDAQNALGQGIVDAQNANGKGIVDARNAMSDQHNQMLGWLYPSLCAIFEQAGGDECTQSIGPLKEHQEHIPLELHWPEGQPTLTERLQQIEMGGDDIREALSDIQRALSIDVNDDAVDERANQPKILTGDSQTLVDNIVKRGEDGGADQAKIGNSRNLLVAGTDAKAVELLKEHVNEMKSKMEDSNRKMEDNMAEMGEKVDAIEGSMKKMGDGMKKMEDGMKKIDSKVEDSMKEMKEMMSQMMKMMG